MITLATIGFICAILLLLVVLGARPYRTTMSRFELERRARADDAYATSLIRRENLLDDVYSLQQVLGALLLVIISALSAAAFGWLLGIGLSLLVALEVGAVAKLGPIQRMAQKIYEKFEPQLLDWIERVPWLCRLLRTVTASSGENHQVESREELLHMVNQAGAILTPDEQMLMIHSMNFHERAVSEVMTPRSVIDSLEKSEMLGPLVLDDLHKTGHSRFPVIDKDIDHVVGVLHIQDIVMLHSKTMTAEKAMEPRVYYIHEDQTLQEALSAFIQTHHHLFVVINQYRETVGLLSLEDVMEALLGQIIVDEFDNHDDLRAVALRQATHNNHPAKHRDV